MKKTGIYRIYNKSNDKSYVGQALDIDVRWNGHKRELKEGCHHNILLQKDWDKYGENSFEFIVLTECKPIELNVMEKLYIDIYNCTITGYNVAEGNRAISKRYKSELLSKDKKEVKVESKYIEQDKNKCININKLKESRNKQLIKDHIRESLGIQVLEDKTITLDAKIFDIYLKVTEISELLPKCGELGSKEYLRCNLYSEIWEIVEEFAGEKYGYIMQMDNNTIKFSPPSLVDSEGRECESDYIYIYYRKVKDRYYLSRVPKKNIYKNNIIAEERLKKPRQNNGIRQDSRLTITRMNCPLLKGLFWMRDYIKNECPKYYKSKLEELDNTIEGLILRTDKYTFKGRLVCIIDGLYIISKVYREEEYYIIDLSTRIVSPDIYTFMLDNWEDLTDIKFKSKSGEGIYQGNRGVEMKVSYND